MIAHRLVVLCVTVLAVAVCPAPAQKKKKSPYKDSYWKNDPYTKNDKAVMKKAGYESFGPFPWGDDHTSLQIQAMFPTTKMLFVETPHFKIASSLSTYKLPKAAKLEKKILKAELTRLKKLFPKIKTSTRTLDPWLRLHLFAMRLEETYADFQKKVGVTDADFPKLGDKVVVKANATREECDKWRGQGPYLGMKGKFLILLMTKGGNLNRYAARSVPGWQHTGAPEPQRTYFTKVGSLFFGTACECAEKSLYNDHALHCHVVFNTVQSMIDGYKDFFYSVPVWTREGLSHWYVRNIDPKEHCFTGMKGRSNKQRYDHKWDVKMKRRMKHNDFTPAKKIMQVMAFDQLTFGDHMAIWSRIDFLLSLGDDKFGRFMGRLKAMISVGPGQVPKLEQVLEQQEQALRLAYGFDYAGFDAKWKAYVLKKYPSR